MPLAGKQPLIVIVGPTGIGKTALGTALAQRYAGEIIGADSRQIYRYMDIGTAKPTPVEQAAVPHHLIDIVDPDQVLTMAEYQRRAYTAIETIHNREKLPLLVGGTGQYITAVVEGWSAPEVPPNPALRAELEAIAATQGPEALVERLKALDPGAHVDPYNVRRLVRALEVCLETGQPFSVQRTRRPPPYRILELGLTTDRDVLYTRLDARIDRMMAEGLLDEVRALHARGYDWQLPSMSALGYGQLGRYLQGEWSLETAVLEIKRATRTFVRRQYTWFRHHGAVQWLESPSVDDVCALVDGWLQDFSSASRI